MYRTRREEEEATWTEGGDAQVDGRAASATGRPGVGFRMSSTQKSKPEGNVRLALSECKIRERVLTEGTRPPPG